MSFGNEYASPDLLTDRRFGAGTEFPHVYVNATPGARLPKSDNVSEFRDALVITIANPALLDVSAGSRLRRRPTRMFERRPGWVRSWNAPPVDLLFAWKCQIRRNLPRARRARIETAPPQEAPLPALVQHRAWRPTQPRGKRWESPLSQVLAPVQNDVPWARSQLRTMRGLLRRKSKPVESVPAQIVLVQSDVPWSRTQARALRGMLSRRAGHPVMFIFPGAAPVVAGTGVYLERDAIRIIPLVTSDGGATWRPRGT